MGTEALRHTELDTELTAPVSPLTREDCTHEPRCPAAYGTDRGAAHIIAYHPEQGWSLLCNGVVLFDDTGEILPNGYCTHARRADLTAAALHRASQLSSGARRPDPPIPACA